MSDIVGDWSFDVEPPSASEKLAIARLEWCLEALAFLGITPNPSSRVPQALKFLKEAAAKPQLLDVGDTRARISEAYRVAWELMAILVAALNADQTTTPFTTAKLKEVLDGGPLPSEARTHARNTQFELYVPALFALAGFDVTAGPPDARWQFAGDDLAIEAKRVRSFTEEKLRDNLDEAAQQILGKPQSKFIEVVKSRGLIAVNIDIHFEGIVPTGDSSRLIDEFSERLKVLDKASEGLLDKYGLVGVLAFGHASHWTPAAENGGVPKLNMVYPTRWASLAGEDPMDRSAGQRFIRAIGKIEQTTMDWRMRIPQRPWRR